jgi:tetratricopeptide (TPR) repeat protein
LEATLNGLGSYLLTLRQYRKALELFELNIRYYPESPAAYAGYAEGLAATGERDRAKEQYEKSLSLQENPEIREKLAPITKE